jgi:hypothetical protein
MKDIQIGTPTTTTTTTTTTDLQPWQKKKST